MARGEKLGVRDRVDDRVAEDQETLEVGVRLAASIQTARVVSDRYLRHFDYWTWPRSRGIEEEYAHFVASEPSRDEFEPKLLDLAASTGASWSWSRGGASAG